jgi:hypothetical protein
MPAIVAVSPSVVILMKNGYLEEIVEMCVFSLIVEAMTGL